MPLSGGAFWVVFKALVNEAYRNKDILKDAKKIKEMYDYAKKVVH
jgi:hypothetical protein